MAKLTFPRLLASFLGAMIISGMTFAGCDSGTTFSANLIPYAERTRLADDAIGQSIAAFNKGDQAKGDAFLHRAVLLLTDSLSGEFNDEGFIEVAERITALGRPNDAIRLLEPLTKDKRVAEDPRLWAALADAASKAANTVRAREAEGIAQREAGKIVAGFGGGGPESPDAAKRAARATYAGQYYSEFARKDYQKAIQCYREALRLMPKDLAFRNNLGYTLADQGQSAEDFDEAVRLTRSVVEKYPDEPFFLDSFGWALYKRDSNTERDLEGARRRLREAVDLAPTVPECRYHLAAVYEKSGSLKDALREAERAVLLKPKYSEAEALVERLKKKIDARPEPAPETDTDLAARPSPAPSVAPPPPIGR